MEWWQIDHDAISRAAIQGQIDFQITMLKHGGKGSLSITYIHPDRRQPLQDLVDESLRQFALMTPEAQREHRRVQAESWARQDMD